MAQIAGGLDVLMAVNCSTVSCETYKSVLTERALEAYSYASDISGDFEPALAMFTAGIGAGSRVPSRAPGSTSAVGSASVQKAVDYLAGVRGAKATGSGARFADQAKLDDHFARHGSDFGAKTTLEYQAQADRFLTASKPAGVLEKTRPNGDVVRYNPSTDEFGVVSSGGSIRTYYKPDPAVHGRESNLDYFNA